MRRRVRAGLALLAPNTALAAAHNAEADPVDRNGRPLTPNWNLGRVLILRVQRKVYRQW
jgi:hypothetical protein